jgi:hypothetical protein
MDKRQETGQAKDKSWPIDRAILNNMETLPRDKREGPIQDRYTVKSKV